jgi:hypothetical protein
VRGADVDVLRSSGAGSVEEGGSGGDSDCEEAMGVRGGSLRRSGASRVCWQAFQGGR